MENEKNLPLGLTPESFDAYRNVQDDYADQVATDIIRNPHHFQVYRQLGQIKKNNDPVDIKIAELQRELGHDDEKHKEFVKLLNDYFENLEFLEFTPEQMEVIKKGCDFFALHASSATLALAVRSLLKQYAAFNATNVLMSTHMLTEYPHRRILETMQFVLDVMDPDGFDPDHYAKRSIQKLRLVHAMIRARIHAQDENVDGHYIPWDQEVWGKPINQQDMIFAIHTFSIEVIDGLKAAGFDLEKTYYKEYYLTWHYIGKALGVKDEINPKTYEEGKALQEYIYSKQFTDQNPNGKALADPLLQFLDELIPLAGPRDVLAIIKLFNDPKDYDPVFKDILKIDVGDASEGFYRLLKGGLAAVRNKAEKEYNSKQGAEQQAFLEQMGYRNMGLLHEMVRISTTWKGDSFRIADGFGTGAGQIDQKKDEKRGPFYEVIRLLWDALKIFWNKITGLFK